ncbi:DNA-binding transcriptional LysR family regulator [Roseibium hamelinense]|uniref:DNA-binding transcriptional LysR family regulator n=1 Tax=Roseibium hamelinense TaxID=150831 RepID=A0A562SJ15_9HYPH|nr:LysR family transcriptional regulator [Roseibium hamelinense]MTI42482.1 LysR family transcriptional regulator [Roseibium hamelinense]TWI80720.1 DNA-binding transcriptional LysR family regulator [Roseibium hamelinense]
MVSSDLPVTALRALRILRECGSVSRTADTLGVSQPAISRAISALEDRYGLQFVRRNTRPVTLTVEGELVASHAERIELDLMDLSDQLARLKKGKAGAVTIGSFGASASTRLLPQLLKAFTRNYPEITVSIREYDDQDILTALNDGVIDTAVLANPPGHLDLVLLGHDELVGIVAQHDRLADLNVLLPADFEARPFVLSKAGSEPLITQWFKENGYDLPPAAHRIRQTASILALVEAGLGVSIMARYALPKDIGHVAAIPLAPAAPRELALARIPDAARSHAASVFWQFAEHSALDRMARD